MSHLTSTWFMLAFAFILPTYVSASTLLANRQSTLIGTTISLDYGTFVGFRNDTNGITYFQGIRYADPPIGELRWRAPVSPPTSPLGTVNATEFAVACIRTVQVTVAAGTSEDCLFGNVYVPPNTSTDDRLPVLVWFHGGGYQTGNTRTAPPNFIMNSSAKPFVFASFEYRLGQFGFLGGSQIKEDGDLNAGFLDQLAALRWVQRYIHNFGGDSKQVTIWGQSAGAGSTMFHLLANNGNNEGLFRAAIGDSPPLTFVPAYNETYVEGVFTQFASFTDCANQGPSTLQCLRSTNITSNMLARAGNGTITARPSTLYVFAPILDYTTIPIRPVEGFSSSPSPANHNTTKFSRVPVLFGSNTNDGANWSSTRIRDPAANTSAPGADEQTLFRFLQGQYASLREETVQEAIAVDGNLYPLGNYDSLTSQAQQMYGEMRFICTAGMIVGAMREAGIVDAYQYHYDNPNLGSDHHDELTASFKREPRRPGAVRSHA
ncbi:unnamed protein product [Cyclocybe aegerita]|uniref:Carboxylic ester hydrolase n=1 Tax=Cyclocybe aegerita TaxID=1973307 RepID=A0A8S0X6U7_CYCAE|nr:unnamed protein product [Cyclocybe aegerita]